MNGVLEIISNNFKRFSDKYVFITNWEYITGIRDISNEKQEPYVWVQDVKGPGIWGDVWLW